MIQKYIVQTTEKIEYYSNTWIFVQKEKAAPRGAAFIIDC